MRTTQSGGPAIHFLALGLLSLFALLFFRGLLPGEAFYFLDFHQTFQPLRAILGESLRNGLPLWNPRLNNGMPLVADPLQAALYPPNLVFAFVSAEIGLTLLTVLHVLFGCWGVWLLGRRWGFSPAAAWTAAAAFGFNGVTASATAFPNLAFGQAWLPWLLLAWDRGTDLGSTRRWPNVAALGIVIAALLLLGDPFIVLAGLIGVLALSCVCLWGAGRLSVRRVGATLATPLLALILALLLAAPFLIAFLAYAPHSVRGAGFPAEGAGYWSFHPGLGLGLLLPNVFGDARLEGFAKFWPRGLVPEKGFPLFNGFYFGSVAVALAILGATSASKRRWPLLAWLGALFLLALGRYGPVYPLLGSLPLANTIRFPMKWLLPAMLPAALLVGFGLDALGRDSGEPGRRRALFVLLALLAALGLISVAASPGLDGWIVSQARDPSEDVRALARTRVLGAVARAALSLLATGGVLFGFSRLADPRRRLLCVSLAAIVAADIGLANAQLAPMLPRGFYRRIPPVVQALRGDPGGHARVYVESPLDTNVVIDPPPADSAERAVWERDALVGYAGAAYGLDLAFNMDPGHFRTFAYGKLGSMVRRAPPRERLMLLGAAGVTHLVTYTEPDASRVETIAVIPGHADRPQRVSRNRLSVPRVRLVPTLVAYDGDMGFMLGIQAAADDVFLRAGFAERNELLRNGIDPDRLPALYPGDSAAEARLIEDTGSVLRVRTRGPAGFLVVNDCFVPGWTAEVDGQAAPLFQADHAFRGVPVPVGDHEVVLRYWPF